MNISIEVWLEDTVFNGVDYFDEKDNQNYKLYMAYEEWINGSKEADKFIDNVTDYLGEWDSNVNVEGGTLMNPNGLIWWLHCKFSSEISDVVQATIEKSVNHIYKQVVKNCPVPLEFRVYVEEE